jgi:hypothetical protein
VGDGCRARRDDGGELLHLTMQFYYFYAFIMLALSVPIVFGRRLRRT